MNIHNNIRVIQISDCHLSSNQQQHFSGRHPDEYLHKVINDINRNETKDCLILATGDLSNDGSEISYQRLFHALSKLNKEVYTLAGNHDDLVSMSKHLSHNRIKNTSFLVKDNWLFLFLNTHVDKEEHGYLSSREISSAKTILEKNQDKHVFIAMHHPPLHVNCAWIDRKNLQNSHDFMSLVSANKNIKAVTFGHVHQEYETVLEGIHYYSCPSTCHQYLPNSDDYAIEQVEAGYRWFNLQHNGAVQSGITRLAKGTNAA